ncbi:hypothetical protein DPMN_067860 [Dreissena polymorpha]|uniref:Uncharacterized protein n=1 Tax=Dreissena polymorpha TaxID=45954 RepID=A0A9D4BT44_DREPO|nr:hypothetical protein DPMN_067860 [Dreissena polymorpha]
MYLPTPITMPGARRIEVGNHSFLTLKHPFLNKRSPWGSNLRPPDLEADAFSTVPRRLI